MNIRQIIYLVLIILGTAVFGWLLINNGAMDQEGIFLVSLPGAALLLLGFFGEASEKIYRRKVVEDYKTFQEAYLDFFSANKETANYAIIWRKLLPTILFLILIAFYLPIFFFPNTKTRIFYISSAFLICGIILGLFFLNEMPVI